MKKTLLAGGVLVAALWSPAPAVAQTAQCPAGTTFVGSTFQQCFPTPEVLGTELRQAPAAVTPAVAGMTVQQAPATEVLGTSFRRAAPASATLPVTGGDVLGLTALGLGALATGAVLVRRSRTRRTA